ncbi:SatD family protein [Sphingomonas sp. Leaf25]|uniref:SatD family protein n=1 Tax=Sphingomonas sp. Leaf25 TaxID=1735692 RepID=UPI0006F40B38|nr:SatD family protein [Sphingomonas sp. Leaf25]KQM98830.1 hypothetical protein ASE78_06310 [Sphingomonas sp. Leaf25]
MSVLAVLMSDIVGSERQGDVPDLHRRFNAAVDRCNQTFADDIVSPLTITLGDEFQGLLGSLVAAMEAARTVRLALLEQNIDCRFVVGTVEPATDINPERAWNMMGPGFADARTRLGEKRSASRYRFSIGSDPLLETMLDASGASLSVIERNWSAAQREDIVRLLSGATVADVAQARGVGIHSIYKVRSAGEYALYLTQWNAVHRALAELDRRHDLPGADKWRMRFSIPA